MLTFPALADLAQACDQYHGHYDLSFSEFKRATLPLLDLTIRHHQVELFNWLNRWGCRLNSDHRHTFCTEVAAWYSRYQSRLPSAELDLLQLDARAVSQLGKAYDDLCRRKVEPRITIGSTATTKILFALRPRLALPWDESIRKGLGYKSGSATDYEAFLQHTQSPFRGLEKLCASNGMALADLPARLGQPDSSPHDILNKYLWAYSKRKDNSGGQVAIIIAETHKNRGRQ